MAGAGVTATEEDRDSKEPQTSGVTSNGGLLPTSPGTYECSKTIQQLKLLKVYMITPTNYPTTQVYEAKPKFFLGKLKRDSTHCNQSSKRKQAQLLTATLILQEVAINSRIWLVM